MKLDKLRYSLTKYIERVFISKYENYMLLIHPSINEYSYLINKLKDDINLMPPIEKTFDNTDIKFYEYDYNECLYDKSELLSFIFASIDNDWDIVKGINIFTGKSHFWLKNGGIIYDPSLAIVTPETMYLTQFKQINCLPNKNIFSYLIQKNNLWKFYHKRVLNLINVRKNDKYSINYINQLIEEFNNNINKQYILDENRIKEIKDTMMFDDFIQLRQILTQKRISYIQSNQIAIHPSVNTSILPVIEEAAKNIKDLMQKEYNISIDYHNGTIGNCYGLSILLNLYDGNFKLIQGGIPYKSVHYIEKPNSFYQHSWLEIDEYVYDPALRIITPKELYYIFVKKQDEYTKEETENILKRIGFNLTHFRDFISGVQIGNDETIRYRCLINKIDTPEMQKEGEELISRIKTFKKE